MFSVLLYDGKSGVATRGDTEKAQKTRFTIPTGPGKGVMRESIMFWPGGRRQEQGESSSQGLYWSFHRKGKAGQDK